MVVAGQSGGENECNRVVVRELSSCTVSASTNAMEPQALNAISSLPETLVASAP
jgi:hypothetical protein